MFLKDQTSGPVLSGIKWPATTPGFSAPDVMACNSLSLGLAAIHDARVSFPNQIMPLMFNTLLAQHGIVPADVILLRHQDQRAARGRTPYELWRDNRPAFERYQCTQRCDSRAKFSRASYWASFVGTPDGHTIFVGLYRAAYKGVLQEDEAKVHTDGMNLAGSCDEYVLEIDERFADLDGKLFIAWGEGMRSWVQRAGNQNKNITELRAEFKEPEFPGFLNFAEPLSRIEGLPSQWIAELKAAKGVYVLTCPRTKEQYVGKASGSEGFWQRWMNYVRTMHGGNIGLRSREPSDYQVSILEVAGSALSDNDIERMEAKWKNKLGSREMGLNKN
jgi:hypothetical protein